MHKDTLLIIQRDTRLSGYLKTNQTSFATYEMTTESISPKQIKIASKLSELIPDRHSIAQTSLALLTHCHKFSTIRKKCMKKYLIVLAPLLALGCMNQQPKARYTKEEIATLQLNSTKDLTIETDSVIGIDLNPILKHETFDFGSKVAEVKIVKLETTNESLLDEIRKVIITDSFIYIFDDFQGGGIVVFEKDGKFIKRIPNGRGPGELIRLYDIAFDSHNDRLIAYQHSYLLYFNALGEFIKQDKLPFGFFNFAIIDSGFVFKTLDGQGNEHLGELMDYTILITDENFKLLSAGMPYLPNRNNMGIDNYLQKNDDLFITQAFNDTIYQYCAINKSIRAKYVLEYRNKIPEKILQANNETFKQSLTQNDYNFFFGKHLDNHTHSVFFLENWHKGFQTVIYRDKKSGNLIGGTHANYNLNEIPPMAYPKWTFREYFISAYYPNGREPFINKSSILSDADKSKLKSLTDDDNPILILFKLHAF